MDEGHRELANRLFATATAMLEDAIEPAVAGQFSRSSPAALARHGRRLRAVLRDIAVLAEAAAIVAELGRRPGRTRRKRRR